jgi:undecaprenyl-diphosphatase
LADWIYAIILGLVEGLTEFIPVSSTGHLLLAKEALGLPDGFWGTFSVLIQLGAILAVVVVYFQRLWGVVLRIPSDPKARGFVLSVLLAFLPAVVIGLAAHDFIKQVLFESPTIICWSLIIGGVGLLFIDRFAPKPKYEDAMELPLLTSLGVGFMQVLSMVPGVSRSGATIVGAVLLGVRKEAATEFSFFLAIPTMLGVFVLDAWENRNAISADQAGTIAVGFVASFVFALIVIKTMVAFVSKRGLAPFGWWRIVVGAVGLALLQFG